MVGADGFARIFTTLLAIYSPYDCVGRPPMELYFPEIKSKFLILFLRESFRSIRGRDRDIWKQNRYYSSAQVNQDATGDHSRRRFSCCCEDFHGCCYLVLI